MTGRVKALEWDDRFGVHPQYKATSVMGGFYITRNKAGLFDWWSDYSRGKHEVRTVDAAKADAQADYERRILSALSPTDSDLLEYVVAAAQLLLDGKQSTYRTRNGKRISIEADDGEACYIVHSDLTYELECALTRYRATTDTPSDEVA